MTRIPCRSSSFLILAVLAINIVPFAIVATAEPVYFANVQKNKQSVTRRENTAVRHPVDVPLLAIQIGGIVGAYLVSVAITLSLLLFVGRRLRRQVQSSNCTLQMEMMTAKPTTSADPSPISPVPSNLPSPTKASGFTMSWSSMIKGHRYQASGDTSVATVDEAVIASDRRKAQEEMEMLYAAVMQHDEERAAGINNIPFDVQSMPRSPLNPQAVPPARHGVSQALGPSPPMSPRSSSRLSKLSSISLFNSNLRGSKSSRKLQSPSLSVRKMPISPPVWSPDTGTYSDEQEPLTPRYYNPGPPPKAPDSHSNLTKSSGRVPAPAPLNMSAANSSSSLPFRDAYPLQSAPATKTTVLERPAHLGHGPRTGVPTPYSPYMPFTPVTPLTPSRMVTRRERKREAKENGLRVLQEDDMVKSDEEMWGY